MQNAPRGAFCNTFDLHKALIDLYTGFTQVSNIDLSGNFQDLCTCSKELIYQLNKLKHTCDAVSLVQGSIVNILSRISKRSSEAAINISLRGVPGQGLNCTKSGSDSMF